MPDREKVIKGLETIRYNLRQMNHGLLADFCDDALALLKEQENQKQNWLKQIADTQLLNAPCEWQSEDQRLYAKGVWDGLQIAWDIISEGR